MLEHLRQADAFYTDLPAGASLPQTRGAYDAMSLHFSGERPTNVIVSDVVIARPVTAVAGGLPLVVRIYQVEAGSQKHSMAGSGALLYFHGGGFALGNLESHDTIVADLCAQTRVPVIAVDYARVPEFAFPAALEDALTAWQWLLQNAESLGADAARLVVGGDSCGATLASNIAHWSSVQVDVVQPIGQLLIYPVLGVDFETQSYIENAEAPNLTRSDMIGCWDMYLPEDIRARYAETVVPNRAVVTEHIAPAAILTAAHDPVCDDGSVYAAHLGRAGIATAYRCDEDLPHGHLRARRTVPSASAAFHWVCAAANCMMDRDVVARST
ncbi:MAG: alpha/beta hydrolase [Pseudomonadota bacterium]